MSKALNAAVVQLLERFSPCVGSFVKSYPLVRQQLLSVDDSDFFLAISQRRVEKLVPLIAVPDALFKGWFKKVVCVPIFCPGLSMGF